MACETVIRLDLKQTCPSLTYGHLCIVHEEQTDTMACLKGGPLARCLQLPDCGAPGPGRGSWRGPWRRPRCPAGRVRYCAGTWRPHTWYSQSYSSRPSPIWMGNSEYISAGQPALKHFFFFQNINTKCSPSTIAPEFAFCWGEHMKRTLPGRRYHRRQSTLQSGKRPHKRQGP